MKKISKPTIGSFILIFVSALTFTFSASAQNTLISQDQTDAIVNNCATLKVTLNQLHSNDALVRVNAGQTYESILSRLMKRFNDRVSYNNIDNSELESIASNFEKTLNLFRSNYLVYEQQLSLVMNIDCSVSAQTFYDAITLARSYRTKVNEDVINLNSLMDQYLLALDKFEIDNKDYIERLNK